MEIYRNTAAYAKENGEIQKWRDSKTENIACRDAVDRAVAENFDGAHLKTEAILDTRDSGVWERAGGADSCGNDSGESA